MRLTSNGEDSSVNSHLHIAADCAEQPARSLETLYACILCGEANFRVIDPGANICECLSCGYLFDNPRPTIESLVSFYSQPTKYDSWLADGRGRDLLWKRRQKFLHRVRKPGSLLDTGSGIAQFLAVARPYFDEVFGTEVSDSAIDIAKRKYGLNLMRGEIDKIDFGRIKFDDITLFHVLELVPNPKLTIERCARLLNKGGVLMIAVPNDLYCLRNGQFFRTNKIRSSQVAGPLGIPRIVLDGSLGEIHLSHFTSAVLGKLLASSGFSVISSTLDPYYVGVGLAKWKQATYFNMCKTIYWLTGM